MTQAAFARLHGVSRKTVTEWKARGYLSISEGLVVVEASNGRLANAGRSRLDPVTRTAASLRTERQGNALDLHQHATDFPGALSLSILAGASWDLALDLLDHLPMATVREVLEREATRCRAAAAEMADDDAGPPPGFASWAAHPWFGGPALTEPEWGELAAEARLRT